MTTWGVVSTVKAPRDEVLAFAAWHLEAGASKLYLYLDEDAPDTLAALDAHPAIEARVTDAAWWAKRKGRPERHQVRQSVNARHASNRARGIDWLVHIDVDEFLIAPRPVADLLSALPQDCLCARVRPIEALAPIPASKPEPAPASRADHAPASRARHAPALEPGPPDTAEIAFKAFPLDQAARQRASLACFPTWGAQLSGGFLSHVAGKLFFRTGLKGLQVRIHNVILDGVQNPGQVELAGIELAHLHAKSWDQFLAAYRFRLAQGSYRAELKPQGRGPEALSLHDLFARIEAGGGEPALRAFYDEVCTATPALCDRLAARGLLRRHRLDLDAVRRKHFPGA